MTKYSNLDGPFNLYQLLSLHLCTKHSCQTIHEFGQHINKITTRFFFILSFCYISGKQLHNLINFDIKTCMIDKQIQQPGCKVLTELM